MNTNQLNCFLECAKELNFTRAAEHLYMTQPGVSRMIGDLENELSTTLFFRTPNKKIELTKSGELYYEFFRSYRDRFREVQSEAQLLETTAHAELKIGYFSGWDLSEILMDVISELQRSYPASTFILECYDDAELFRRISEGSLDVIINLYMANMNTSNLIRQEVFQLQKAVIYKKDAALHSGENIRLKDFSSVPFYIFRTPALKKAEKSLTAICKRAGFQPEIKIVSNQNSVISMVENGFGCAIMDMWCQTIHRNTLSYLPIEDYHKIYLLYNPHSDRLNIISDFAKLFQKYVMKG